MSAGVWRLMAETIATWLLLTIVVSGCSRDAGHYEKKIREVWKEKLQGLEVSKDVIDWTFMMEKRASSMEEREKARLLRIEALGSLSTVCLREMEESYEDFETTTGRSRAALKIGSFLAAGQEQQDALDWFDRFLASPDEHTTQALTHCYIRTAGIYIDMANLVHESSDGYNQEVLAYCHEQALECYNNVLSVDPSFRDRNRLLLEDTLKIYERFGAPGRPVEWWRKKLRLDEGGP